MAKTSKNLGLMLATLILILACATPATPPPSGFVETAIAGTHSVAASQTAQAKALQPALESLTPTGTRMPSATPLPTFTVVFFGEPEVRALVTISCRKGPGQIYDQVFLFRVGRLAGLVGKSADGFYLIIRNPNNPEQLCWVPTQAVQINGIYVTLRDMTVPPTPRPTHTSTSTRRPPPTITRTPLPATATNTPVATATNTQPPLIQFDLLYSGTDDCPTTLFWWLNFELGNTGDVDFESLSLTLTDNDTATVFTFDDNVFTNRNGCGPAVTEAVLPVGGGSLIVSAPELTYNPAGHNFSVTITLYDEDGQLGLADTQIIPSFVP